MKNTIIVMTYLLLANAGFGQPESKKTIRRDVLLVKRYIGSYSLKEKSSIKKFDEKGNRIFSSSIAGNFNYIFLPYDIKWPLSTYLRELHPELLIYVYNDIFASSEVFSDVYRQYANSDKHSPRFNLDELSRLNDYYVMQTKNGAVSKIWIVEGEWEEHSLKEKPDLVKAITPRTLVFDTYNVLLLKKIISIRPVKKLEIKDDSFYLKVKNNVVLTNCKSKSKNQIQH